MKQLLATSSGEREFVHDTPVSLSKAWSANRELFSLHKALHGMLNSPQPRLKICPGGDREHLIFLHPHNLPKASLQQWEAIFCDRSLRQLSTQRHLWESSLSLSDSPLLNLFLSWHHSCYLLDMNTHMLTHTYAHKHSLIHIHIQTPQTHTHTHTESFIHGYSPLSKHTLPLAKVILSLLYSAVPHCSSYDWKIKGMHMLKKHRHKQKENKRIEKKHITWYEILSFIAVHSFVFTSEFLFTQFKFNFSIINHS